MYGVIAELESNIQTKPEIINIVTKINVYLSTLLNKFHSFVIISMFMTHVDNTLSQKKIPVQKNNKVEIHPDMNIAELVSSYPEIGEMLSYEWGFHCANCFISNFESLRQGAEVHGIIGEDFEIMFKMIQMMVETIDRKDIM